MPRFSDDDVTDFLVAEAVAGAYGQAKDKAVKDAERKARVDEWKQNAGGLPGG